MWVENLLGRPDEVFCLLEDSSRHAQLSVRALARSVGGAPTDDELNEIRFSRLQQRALKEEVQAAVQGSLYGVLQSDDIERISRVLYKISKNLERFASMAQAASRHIQGVDFSRQIQLLEGTMDVVSAMVKSLREGMDPVKAGELNRQLQDLEGKADRHMLLLYQDLFSGRHEALQVIALKDLYETLEKVIDRCRDTGKVIHVLLLKSA